MSPTPTLLKSDECILFRLSLIIFCLFVCFFYLFIISSSTHTYLLEFQATSSFFFVCVSFGSLASCCFAEGYFLSSIRLVG